MKLHRLSFPHAAFLNLPKEEQSFFLTLAAIRDDLRSLDSFCLAAVNGLKSRNKLQREVSIHQLLFGIRLLCGTLNEAWNVIVTGWNGSPLGRQFSPRLPAEAKDALKALKKYFGKRNLVGTIRNKFAFHYDAEPLLSTLQELHVKSPHAIITGRTSGNVFYSVAENVRNVAMILAGGQSFSRESFRQLFDEPHHVYDQFAKFSDAVLLAIAESLPVSQDMVSVGTGYKMAKLRPPTFLDEKSVMSPVTKKKATS